MNNKYIILSIIVSLLTVTACKKEDPSEITGGLPANRCGQASVEEKKKDRMPSTYYKMTYSSTQSCYTPKTPATNPPTAQSCYLQFGYTNTVQTYTVNIGEDNRFSYPSGAQNCSGYNCGQPKTFYKSTTNTPFRLFASKPGTYKWTLEGNSVTGVCGTSLPVCSTLAVKFGEFNAYKDTGGLNFIHVNWTTETESDVSHFIVKVLKPCETDFTDALTISTKAPSGNSSSKLIYDSLPPIAVNVRGPYQVKVVQIDKYGNEQATTIKLVRF